MQNMPTDYETIEFKDSASFRKWLDAHFEDTNGVWLRLYKKASGEKSITYAEALDEALCYGWIDGQSKRLDDVSYIQKFTPRRARSLWSKRNIEYIARLTDAGLMKPSGIAEVERAKEDGRWAAAYDKPSEMVVPDDLLHELHKFPKAEAYFNTLNKTNTYAICWSLQTAKTEVTRKRRLDKFVEMLKKGEKLY